jgi:hypothetical protein
MPHRVNDGIHNHAHNAYHAPLHGMIHHNGQNYRYTQMGHYLKIDDDDLDDNSKCCGYEIICARAGRIQEIKNTPEYEENMSCIAALFVCCFLPFK